MSAVSVEDQNERRRKRREKKASVSGRTKYLKQQRARKSTSIFSYTTYCYALTNMHIYIQSDNHVNKRGKKEG